jgi:CubicO group peptidase (beta-lactamase class C family)
MRWQLLPMVLLGFAGASALYGYEITPEHFAMAAQYSRSHGGVALRVQQGGKVMAEDYAPGFSASTPHKIYSGTKSFVALTALFAVQDGLLSLDERASETLTEWRQDRRRDITVAQLLSHTSGLGPGDDVIYPARDQFAAALRVRLIDPPGARFHYGATGYQALGEILRRKLRPSGQTVEGYIRKRLLHPLDLHVSSWKHDEAGNPILHTGMQLTTREWAKLGEFIKICKNHDKKQLIDNRLLQMLFIGAESNPAYGIGFWLNAPLPHPCLQPILDLQPAIDGDQIYPGGPQDLYTGIGSGKQRLYIIPSLDLVVVRFGHEAPFSDGDFLSRLLTGRPQPDAHTH